MCFCKHIWLIRFILSNKWDMQSIIQNIHVNTMANDNDGDCDDDDSMDEWIAYKENLFVSSKQQPQHNFVGKRRRKPVIDLKDNQFLVGYNRMDNLIAITLVEQSRRSTDDRSNCLAICLRYVCT